MQAIVTHEDLKHLKTFPPVKKWALLHEIMARAAEAVSLEGAHSLDDVVQELRENGFGLIDFQSDDKACAAVWYRRDRPPLRRPRGEVAMLLWEAHEDERATMMFTWSL